MVPVAVFVDAGLRRQRICLKIFCTEVTSEAVGVCISERWSMEKRAKIRNFKRIYI